MKIYFSQLIMFFLLTVLFLLYFMELQYVLYVLVDDVLCQCEILFPFVCWVLSGIR